MKKNYVYMILETGVVMDACLKIGFSYKPESRLKEMQVGNPRPLKMAAKLGPFSEAQAVDIERKLHRVFKKYHVRGEWFDAECLNRMDMVERYDNFVLEQKRISKKHNRERKREKAIQ